MCCYYEAPLSVLWDREKLDSFVPMRGIRKGDTVFLYIYFSCVWRFLVRRFVRMWTLVLGRALSFLRIGRACHIYALQMMFYCLGRHRTNRRGS